jgi:hypothetical protein
MKIPALLKSKTFYGAIIGLAALAVALGLAWENAPAPFVKVSATISMFLVVFGIMDAANQQLVTWIEKIKAFKSRQPMIGVYLLVLVTVVDAVAGGSLPVSGNIVVFAQGFSIVITLLGLRSETIKARLSNAPRSHEAQLKYKVE